MATPMTSEEVQRAADEYRAVWFTREAVFENEEDAAEWLRDHQQIDWLNDSTPIEQCSLDDGPCEACQ